MLLFFVVVLLSFLYTNTTKRKTEKSTNPKGAHIWIINLLSEKNRPSSRGKVPVDPNHSI